jgi:hypothetical protein
MKRSGLTLLVVLWFAAAVFAAPRCIAQSRGTFEFSPVVGAYIPHSQLYQPPSMWCGEMGPEVCARGANTAFAVGGRVTAWLDKRIAIEGSLWHAPVPGTSSDEVLAGHVRMLWGVIGGGNMRAYVVGGPAFVHRAQQTTGLAGVIGAGAHFRVASGIAIRTEIEEYRSSQGDPAAPVPQWDLMISLGLSFAFQRSDR